MDHDNATHDERVAGGAAALANEVDAGLLARLKVDRSRAKAAREDCRDMTIGHDKAITDDKAGAAIGVQGVTR
jgi:hypothetical protein